MKFSVTVKIEGYIEIETDGKNECDVRNKINKMIEETDFGDLNNITWDYVGIDEV